MTETWRCTGLISLSAWHSGINRAKTASWQPALVSSLLLPYDNREVVTENNRMRVDYNCVKPHESKPSLIRMMEKESRAPEWNGQVSFGAVLTGGAKIRCTQYRDELVNEFSKRGELVVGGEMEGVGMLAACDPEEPTWILVKGISDYADEQRDNDVENGRDLA